MIHNDIFQGLFDTDLTVVTGVKEFLVCMGVSLLAGLLIALMYMVKTRHTKSFVMTLALLPAVVCVVIMMVNGNIGTGVAVAGAFSLVRFRSVPGTAKEICAIFIAMGTGLIAGMGYIAYALLFALIVGAAMVIYSLIDFGSQRTDKLYKTIRITIAEDLDYTDVFTDVFEKYTSSFELKQVKTTNMGSMFRLTYDIVLNEMDVEKKFIDELRVRNGNLEITISNQENLVPEL